MSILPRSIRWAQSVGLVILVVAAGDLKARSDPEFMQEIGESVDVFGLLYPAATQPDSALRQRMDAVRGKLKAEASPIMENGEAPLIVGFLAAKEAGLESSATTAADDPASLGRQAFMAVEKRHPDLYGLTSEFSIRFWENAWYVRHHEPEEVFISTPGGDAIARSIRELHPKYAAQWPLVCMALVEKNAGLELKRRTMPLVPPLLQKMQSIIFPTVTCKGASIDELVEYMRIKSRDLDPEHVGVNVLLKAGGSPSPAQITLDLKKVPMDAALRYIAELAGMTYEVTPDAVLVGPAKGDAAK